MKRVFRTDVEVEINGRTQTAAQWMKERKLDLTKVYNRRARGNTWPEALATDKEMKERIRRNRAMWSGGLKI